MQEQAERGDVIAECRGIYRSSYEPDGAYIERYLCHRQHIRIVPSYVSHSHYRITRNGGDVRGTAPAKERTGNAARGEGGGGRRW